MSESGTILRPPWLGIARVIWLLLATLAIVIFAVSTVATLSAPRPRCTVPDAVCSPYALSQEDLALAEQSSLVVLAISLLGAVSGAIAHLIWVAVALVLFWRKSDDWMAFLLSLMMVLFVFEGLPIPGALRVVANVLYGIAVAIFMFLPFLFPTGRFVPRWTMWIGVPLVGSFAIGSMLGDASSGEMSGDVWLGTIVLAFLWLALALYAVVYRYRRISNAVERQQTKWVMAGILGWSITIVPVAVIAIALPPTQPSAERLAFVLWVMYPVYLASYVLLAACILIAVLRYRLWDIDFLIRRTVTYALVTGLLLIVFFGSVILLQQIFAGVTGSGQNELVTVLSTLAIAALFVPVRNKIQDVIDRRFNRKKYDAQKVMEKFGETVRDETDLEKLTGELVQVVQETMQPKSVSVWLSDLQREERSARTQWR